MELLTIIDLSTQTIDIIFTVIAVASLLIKVLPELPEDHKLKPIIKWIGKNVALNRKSPNKLEIKLQNNQ